MFRRLSRLVWCVVAASGLAAVSASALAGAESQYPQQAIRLVVATAPGGGGDMIARIFADGLSKELKQPVVVENKPGASGVIAATSVLRSAPDGYTLLLAVATYVQVPAIQKSFPFDPKSDFIPISLVARSSSVLLVNRKMGVKTVAELAAAMAANPTGFNFGSWGNGSTAHFMGELLNLKTNSKAAHVAYKGSGPMLTDLLAGVISFAFTDVGAAQPHLPSDRVLPLAVLGNRRIDSLPEVPTMGEAGFDGFDVVGWVGVLVPRGTPADIVAILERASVNAGKSARVRQRLTDLSLEPVGSNSAEFASHLQKDMATWAEIAEKAGMKAE
ncbi:tripartite tricarboxylate transporter substrate binding protein [Pusillimonas sp. SM2304]|uniref:Bug family tripartite tricarboxylate transporter substrate binding protein n=1 Tax=Pusillimonas sp. SM2304 TaxID=3073241 RepID=UPI002876C88A|nr:tripartite tricarboxylate transporter substrate binding protein [Pusillimonas sp. SM2304]MDS1139216.1 tripartite tricarboxylate transporter substrate binding protein [Pusillimonas sp. SM2304]